ncbi:MAG: magnesium-protoporphyrin IX monomethyl ester (oxidative) cyclase, partial [Pseudomonadota bacterium]
TLDIDHPRWQPTLEKLHRANVAIAEAKEAGGVGGKLKQFGASLRAALCFASLLFIPSKSHKVPESVRLEPVY